MTPKTKSKGWIVWVLLGALVVLIATRDDGDRVAATDPQEDGGAEHLGAAPGAAPTRILPGSAAAVDWVAALGVSPTRLVALPEQADTYSLIQGTPGPWSGVPRYGRLTSEVALGFEPDLVMVSSISDASAVARIRAGTAQVMTVKEPAQWEELLGEGLRIAGAVGEEEAGARLIEGLKSRRQALRSRGAAPLTVLPYGNFGGGGSTAGAGTTLDLALQLAGYENAAKKAGIQGYANVTFERVLTMEFDAVLVLGDGAVTGEGTTASQSATALRNSATLREVEAIRAERFIVLSAALYSTCSLTILDAAEEVARQGDAFPL